MTCAALPQGEVEGEEGGGEGQRVWGETSAVVVVVVVVAVAGGGLAVAVAGWVGWWVRQRGVAVRRGERMHPCRRIRGRVA